MRRFLALLILATTFGCHGYIVHPGAVNTFDSQTFDALMAAKTTIDTARVQFTNKTLPDSLKPAFNVLIKSYDAAFPAYKAWHDAANKGVPADQFLAALNKDIADLTKALASFKGGH